MVLRNYDIILLLATPVVVSSQLDLDGCCRTETGSSLRRRVSQKTQKTSPASVLRCHWAAVLTEDAHFQTRSSWVDPFALLTSGERWCHSYKPLPSPCKLEQPWGAVRPQTATRSASGDGVAAVAADQPAVCKLFNIHYNKRQTLANKNKRYWWIFFCPIIISDNNLQTCCFASYQFSFGSATRMLRQGTWMIKNVDKLLQTRLPFNLQMEISKLAFFPFTVFGKRLLGMFFGFHL